MVAYTFFDDGSGYLMVYFYVLLMNKNIHKAMFSLALEIDDLIF